jgi:diguanylate cyclase (GGDEF)-like protein
MARPIGEIIRTLRFKLLASLLLLLGFSIGASLIGIWTYQQDRYTELAKAEALRANRSVERALLPAMVANDWGLIRRTTADIYEIFAPANLGIIGGDGTVLVAGDSTLEGHRFDRHRAPECTACHSRPDSPPSQGEIFLETPAGPVLRHVIKLTNESECRSCHDPGQQNLGVLFYDAPLGELFATLRTVLTRTLLTGALTFLVLALVLSLIVGRYVHRPLRQLEEGFVRAGQGDFDHWVEVKGGGEFQDMAVQFNVMNQAIKRSFAEIRRKNWETEQLYTFVRRLSQETEWHNRLRRVIVELLLETFKAEQVALLLRREKRESEITEISWRESDDRRCQHREDPAPPAAGELPAWLEQAWEHWRRTPASGIAFGREGSVALASLATQHVSLGLLCIHRPESRPFDEMEKKLLAAVCEQIEVALANARHYRLAITDGLTGLYSKRYCEAEIRKFIDTYGADRRRTFSVLMIDLDNFKPVNDTHGHQVGDEVLAQLADLIRQHIRQDDIACRYGGEEFIVLMAGGAREAEQSAIRLCRTVSEHLFHCQDGLKLRNTISIGVAGFPEHGRTAAEVIGAADQALYAAKRGGRNLCRVA